VWRSSCWRNVERRPPTRNPLPDRKLRAVAVDPQSTAATLIKPLTIPLRNAGVKLLLPSTSDIVVAHGAFLDTLAAGRWVTLGSRR
jgi:hypothetical protein